MAYRYLRVPNKNFGLFWQIYMVKYAITFLNLHFTCYLNLFTTDMPNIQPMIIGIWCGEGKPKPINEYFLAFVNEVNQLIETGITVNGWHINIGVRCFICDSPARALIKGKYSFI